MKVDKFREIIQERNRISIETQDEWDYGIGQCCKQEIAILVEDLSSTLQFLKEECTAEEFMWISEITDELAETTHGKEIIDCYKTLIDKYPIESKKYNILNRLKFAEAALKEGDSNV